MTDDRCDWTPEDWRLYYGYDDCDDAAPSAPSAAELRYDDEMGYRREVSRGLARRMSDG